MNATVGERFSPQPRFVWPNDAKCAAMLCFDVDGETTALSEDPKLAHRRTLMSQCEYLARGSACPGPASGCWTIRASARDLLHPWLYC